LTTEIFIISKMFQTNPVTYQLKDVSENIIRGCFYEQEIKLTNFPDTFFIERIIRKNKNKIFVKWLGLGPEYNLYVNSTYIKLNNKNIIFMNIILIKYTLIYNDRKLRY